MLVTIYDPLIAFNVMQTGHLVGPIIFDQPLEKLPWFRKFCALGCWTFFWVQESFHVDHSSKTRLDSIESGWVNLTQRSPCDKLNECNWGNQVLGQTCLKVLEFRTMVLTVWIVSTGSFSCGPFTAGQLASVDGHYGSPKDVHGTGCPMGQIA